VRTEPVAASSAVAPVLSGPGTPGHGWPAVTGSAVYLATGDAAVPRIVPGVAGRGPGARARWFSGAAPRAGRLPDDRSPRQVFYAPGVPRRWGAQAPGARAPGAHAPGAHAPGAHAPGVPTRRGVRAPGCPRARASTRCWPGCGSGRWVPPAAARWRSAHSPCGWPGGGARRRPCLAGTGLRERAGALPDPAALLGPGGRG